MKTRVSYQKDMSIFTTRYNDFRCFHSPYTYDIFNLSVEAVHLANLLCQFGYYFPVNELKNLLVKDDSSLYRFQVKFHQFLYLYNMTKNKWPQELYAKRTTINCRHHIIGHHRATHLTTSNTRCICTKSQWKIVVKHMDSKITKR